MPEDYHIICRLTITWIPNKHYQNILQPAWFNSDNPLLVLPLNPLPFLLLAGKVINILPLGTEQILTTGGATTESVSPDGDESYQLKKQIGHILRKASQRHTSIFSERMIGDLTPTRFAVLATLTKKQPLSQNELGRCTAMDVATIKGVVDRLKAIDLVSVKPDENDGRRNLIALTKQGAELIEQAIPIGCEITTETLAPLENGEQVLLIQLLNKII
jgi:DNA-binding MarR family transcriptional regulator